jgi:hypothetical protein
MKRVDEDSATALVQTGEPESRLPSFVRHLVKRLKVLCPTLGKKRIAQMLARAGLHLGVTTVGRMLKEEGCFRHPLWLGSQAEGSPTVGNPDAPYAGTRGWIPRAENVSEGQGPLRQTCLHRRCPRLLAELQGAVRPDEVVVAAQQLKVVFQTGGPTTVAQ